MGADINVMAPYSYRYIKPDERKARWRYEDLVAVDIEWAIALQINNPDETSTTVLVEQWFS